MPLFKRGEVLAASGIHIVTASSALSMDGTLVRGMGAVSAHEGPSSRDAADLW